MPIEIIGQSRTIEARSPLQDPPIADLPSPGSVPENTPVMSDDALFELSRDEHPLVRTFAVGRLALIETDQSTKALLERLSDPEPQVVDTALRALVERKGEGLVEALAARFAQGSGRIAAQAARALARQAPEHLLEMVKTRGRLDDEAFAVTTAELARTELEGAIDYLAKAMNRAGTQSPERRGALYAAALLSGHKDLCARVVGLAVSDSRLAESGRGTSPARAALASVGGLGLNLALKAAGEALLREMKSNEALAEHLSPEVKTAFEAGLGKGELSLALSALSPVLELAPTAALDDERASIIRRRRGLLQAILDKREQIGGLDPSAAALFVFLALDTAKMVALAAKTVESSPALTGLAKVLETEPQALVASSEEDLQSRFSSLDPRVMRRVSLVLANEVMFDPKLLQRFVATAVKAGQGEELLDAVASAKAESFAIAVLKAFENAPREAEEAVIKVLNRRPVESGPSTAALAVAARVATKRVALTLARRFLELREIARLALADAIFRIGDPALAPILEVRAFPDEPEELAWVLLSLIAKAPREGKLAEALARFEQPSAHESEIHLPLRCKVCREELLYGFEGVWVDPQAEGPDGDPAFVGDPSCKACGAYDQLETTPAALQLMTESMMQFLSSAEEGTPPPTAVLPRTTKVLGKETGFAVALRTLNKEVETSPDAIRPRLRRARLLLLLQRARAAEDLDRLGELDAQSLEAALLRAGLSAQSGELEKAVQDLTEILDRLRKDDRVRLYETEPEPLLRETEDSLLELESRGAKLPDDLDLDDARERRAQIEEAQAQMMEAARSKMERQDPRARVPAAAGEGVPAILRQRSKRQ